jgi:hypothetical protein
MLVSSAGLNELIRSLREDEYERVYKMSEIYLISHSQL